jgi:hypothetical protein
MNKTLHKFIVSFKLWRQFRASPNILVRALDGEPNKTMLLASKASEELKNFNAVVGATLPSEVRVVGPVSHRLGAIGVCLSDTFNNFWVLEATL